VRERLDVAKLVASSIPAADGVTFRNVSKYFGDVCAVRDLNLSVGRGEFLTLLGPSGSGKTTTLMILAGFQMPTSGEIEINGRPIQNVPPYKRDIGMVFQNYALFPHMTVKENIAFPLSVRGVSKSDMQGPISRALDLVRLTGLSDRRPTQLSGGQQQRVALARALVFEPLLILMDEPLGALDRQLREKLQIEIKHIHAKLGVTLVYVTHDQSEALTMSNRVAVFNDGAVQQVDSPIDIYERPSSAFVAQFIGESNQLGGKLTSRNGPYCEVKLESGYCISSFAITDAPVGSSVIASSRPERLLLAKRGNSAMQSVSGTIVEAIYHGDYWRVRLRSEAFGKDTLIGKVANGCDDFRIATGEEVSISWRQEDWRAFDPAPITAGRSGKETEK
jgi:putative spermidine/putrescine transport system ATP-binding protein